MRRYYFFILVLLAIFFVQLVFSGKVNPIRIKPDFLLIALIFFNFYADFKESVGVALFAGFLKDSFTSGIFGMSIFSFLVCTILLAQYKRYIYREDLILKVVLVFLISLVNGLLNYFVILLRVSAPFFTSFFLVILPESLYTTLVSPLVIWAMRRCALKYSI